MKGYFKSSLSDESLCVTRHFLVAETTARQIYVTQDILNGSNQIIL